MGTESARSPAEFSLGELDSALRSDIRRLGAQLGDALVRQHGPELLERVEQVRGLARGLRRSDEDSTALAELLAGVDVADAGLLARAFTVYFHLANTAEQVHRIDDLTEKRAAGANRFGEMVGRLSDMGFADDEIVFDRQLDRAAPGVHRPPHRGVPPLDPRQAGRDLKPHRAAGPRRRGRHCPAEGRPPDGRADRRHLADRRAAPAEARPGGTRPGRSSIS